MDYKNSGVDIEAGYKSVELMKEQRLKRWKIRFSYLVRTAVVPR